MKLSEFDRKRLDKLLNTIERDAENLIGYPCNDLFNYTPLFGLFKHSINNVGDPFVQSTYRINTHKFETEVINFIAELMHAPKDDFWGYVTNGGTEGNMYGMYLARELFPKGIVYYSEDTHYSVHKILRLIGARSIMIRSLPSGEIDYDDLVETLKLHRDVPPILFVNIGTTMKGALDNVEFILESLESAIIKKYYIHCDAALSGMILPFTDDAPIFDFRLPVDSISISGHKMIGSPIPCGIVLAKQKNVNRIARSVEYIGTLDTTITGSRNGITPVLLWYAIKSQGVGGFKQIITNCLKIAAYAENRLNDVGLNAWRNPHSITVVFDRPPESILRKWSLAVYKNIAHIITMPHVSREHIDRFITELEKEISVRK
jgi:histidine decarboxylase